MKIRLPLNVHLVFYTFEIRTNAPYNKVKQTNVPISRRLSAQGIRIENERKEDDIISVYEVLPRGATEFIRYSNIAP